MILSSRKIINRHCFRSPAYGITLAAETKNGSVICAETCSIPRAVEGETNEITIPEDLAKEAVYKLFDEIYKVKSKEFFTETTFELFLFLSVSGRCYRFVWSISEFSLYGIKSSRCIENGHGSIKFLLVRRTICLRDVKRLNDLLSGCNISVT